MYFQNAVGVIARTTCAPSLLSLVLVKATSLDTFTTPLPNSVSGLSTVVAVAMTTTLTPLNYVKEGAKVSEQCYVS